MKCSTSTRHLLAGLGLLVGAGIHTKLFLEKEGHDVQSWSNQAMT
jgi:hypothetical protein